MEGVEAALASAHTHRRVTCMRSSHSTPAQVHGCAGSATCQPCARLAAQEGSPSCIAWRSEHMMEASAKCKVWRQAGVGAVPAMVHMQLMERCCVH